MTCATPSARRFADGAERSASAAESAPPRPAVCGFRCAEPRLPAWAGSATESVLILLQELGNTHFAPEGPNVLTINIESGEQTQPVLIDRVSGRPVYDPVFRPTPARRPTSPSANAMAARSASNHREKRDRQPHDFVFASGGATIAMLLHETRPRCDRRNDPTRSISIP